MSHNKSLHSHSYTTLNATHETLIDGPNVIKQTNEHNIDFNNNL